MSEESIQQSSQHSQQQQPVPPSAVSSSTTSKTNRNNHNNNSNSHGASLTFSTRTTSANNTMEQNSDWIMMQLNSKSQKPPSLSSQAMMMRTMRLSEHAPTQQPQQLVGESKEGVSRTTTCNMNTNNNSIHMNNIMMNMPNMTSAGSNSGVYRPLDTHDASSHEQQEIRDDHALKHHESFLQLLTTNPIMKQQVAHSERRNQNNLFVQQPQLARHPHQVSLTSSPPTHPTPETKSETGVRPFQVATPSHAFFSSSPIPTRLLLLQQHQPSSSQSTYSYQVPAMSEQQQAAPKETNSSLQVASFSSTALYNMINPNTIENNNSGLHPQERLFFGEPSVVNILSCETSHAGNSINNTSTTRACESSAHHPHAEAVDMPNTTMHVAQQQPASLSSMQQQPTPQVATPLSAITTSMYGIHALEKTSSPTTCMTDERSPSLPTSSNTSLKMSEATSTSSTSNTTSTTSATFTPTLMNNACIFCKLNHKKCDKVAYPPGCSNCVKSQKQCVYSQARKRGPKTSQPPIHPITGAVQYQFIDHTLSNTVGSSNKRKSKTTNASTGKQAHAMTTSSSSSDSLQNNAVSGTSTVVVMAEPSHSSSSSPSPALLCESNSAYSTTATTNMTATTSASATNSAAMRYFTERSYLNNLELVELERKLFSNISESIYRKMALSLIPPCKDSAFLKYWISVSISGQKSNITDSDIRNIDLSQPLGNSHLAILFLIHALVFSRVGRKNHSKAMYEKAREYLSRCFDQIGDVLVLCAYSLMSYYMLGIIDCSKTLKLEHGSASSSEISLCKKEELEMQPTIMMIHPPQSSVSSSLTSLSSFPSSATTTTTPTSLNPSGNETCMGQCLLRAKYFHYMCETFLNAIMIEDDGKEQACSVHAHGITTTSSTIGNNQTPVTVSAPHMQQATREYIQQGLAMTRAFFIPENLDSHIRNVLNSPQNKINYPFMDLVDESSYLEFQILQHVNILNGVVRNIARRHIMRGDGIENSQNGIPKTISTSSISTKSGNATSYLQGTQTIAESITPPLQSVPQSSPIENRPIIQLDTHDSTDLLVQKLDILIKYLKHVVGEEHCFHIILQSLGLKALILFRHRKFVDSTLSLQLMSVVNEITNMTKDNQFKFANINAVFPVEIATKIHCDALHGLVIESSINLMLEYVENLYQQLSQDYMNLLLICEKASLLKFRYSHLLEHAHVCMESYERLKRTNPERFISSAAFVSKR